MELSKQGMSEIFITSVLNRKESRLNKQQLNQGKQMQYIEFKTYKKRILLQKNSGHWGKSEPWLTRLLRIKALQRLQCG